MTREIDIIAMVLEKTFQNSVAITNSGPQDTTRQPGRMQPPYGSNAQVLRGMTVGVSVSEVVSGGSGLGVGVGVG